jgi:RNA polymerase primary sigma factor
VPADQPGPESNTVSSPSRSRTVAARSAAATQTSAPVTAAAEKAPAKKAAAKSAAGTRSAAGTPRKTAARKPAIAPSPGAGKGAVLTAVASDGNTVAVVDAGAAGLTLDETVVTGKDGVAVAEPEEKDAEGGDFEWDDEEESEALRQARRGGGRPRQADRGRAVRLRAHPPGRGGGPEALPADAA